MTQATTGKSTFQGILTSPVTGTATYAGSNGTNGTTVVGTKNFTTGFTASPATAKANYTGIPTPPAATGASSYTAMNPTAPVTVVTSKNTPQS